MEIDMVNMFYGDGDHHKNMAILIHNYVLVVLNRFTSLSDNEFYAYGRSRIIHPS